MSKRGHKYFSLSEISSKDESLQESFARNKLRILVSSSFLYNEYDKTGTLPGEREKYHFSFLIFMLVLFNKMNGNQTASIARCPPPPAPPPLFFYNHTYMRQEQKHSFFYLQLSLRTKYFIGIPRSDGYEIRPVLGKKLCCSAQQSDRVFNKLPLFIRKVS